MRVIAFVIASVLFTAGCEKISTVASPSPKFELRDFVVTETKEDGTEYSKPYNTFKGAGTIVARNVEGGRNLLVYLEAHDKTEGASAEPLLTAVLVRGGLGKVEVTKSEYGEMSKRPDYQWSVLGWQELHKATISVPGQQP